MMQYAACLAALSSETDDILAALDQLDADSIEHAEFLATYHDQASDNCVFVLLSILDVCIIALLANVMCIHASQSIEVQYAKTKISMAFDLVYDLCSHKADFSAGGRVVSTKSEQSGV